MALVGVECEMGLSQQMGLSGMKTNTICIFSHTTSFKHFRIILLPHFRTHIPRCVYLGIPRYVYFVIGVIMRNVIRCAGICMNIWLIIWYRGGEEPFMHIHTNFQWNLTNNFKFTAHLMRVGSSVKSDNFTAWTRWSQEVYPQIFYLSQKMQNIHFSTFCYWWPWHTFDVALNW